MEPDKMPEEEPKTTDIGALLDSGPDAKWFTVPGTKVEVLIRVPTPGEKRRMLKACTRRKRTRRGSEEIVDNEEFNTMLLEASVKDWRNLFANGQPLPCNPATRAQVDSKWDAFSALWNAVIEHANKVADEVEKQLEGN